MDDIAQQAISSALSGNWEKALEYNEVILKDTPDNTDAMVRSAKALIELGNSDKAKKVLEKVIKIDPYNSIASKTLLKIDSSNKAGEITHNKINSEMFIEEPGKTKLTELTHLGDTNIILQLEPGDEVKIISAGRTISINTLNDKHVGRLSDSLSFRLKKLISDGFEFQAMVKSTTSDCVKIFIREVSKPEGFEKIMSFPIEREEISENNNSEDESSEDEY